MYTIISREQLDAAATKVCALYEKTAPTVSEWADWLYSAPDADVTLYDLFTLQTIANEEPQANYAANRIYHLMERKGLPTIGHAGF